MNKLNKKGESSFGDIILLFIGIIVLVVLATQIFNQQSELTTKNVVGDEIISVATAKIHGNDFNASVDLEVANAPTGWKVEMCPLESIVVTNASGHELTLTTDYTLGTATGILNIVNNTDTTEDFDTNNNSLVDYTFCLDGYNVDGSSRSMARLIGLFTVLALLGFIFYYVKFEY